MSSPSPKGSASTREVVAIVAGGLLVLVCCAGPALLAAGVLGATGGALRSPILVGLAAVAVAVAVGALALRRAGHRDQPRPCGPPPADSAASDRPAPRRREGGGPAEPLDRKE